ncbi:aldehyde dehydrogenase family protein [Leeia sp. TBRC 13508]|uniref:Aldehyde dehydrogenase family protein n=1 Tax=Leeia speluncae TaxID=2884804 RepID=A0ABS8DAX3_9NEIS|nr:aldehyde dehydrogenase family protein [Leeia speluncae]MCB6185369.1 aldehyde dehydrogenase family protein [Leeia speluncae]
MNANQSTFQAQESLTVYAPFDGRVVGHVPLSTAADIPVIMEKARLGTLDGKQMSRTERARILNAAAEAIAGQIDTFALTIANESGKALRQARKEVARCINTLRLSAEEAKRVGGEIIPFSAYQGSENRQGYFTQEPLGIVFAVTPFNDPLNLAAHKLGPAIAAGNAVILKPSGLSPLSAQKLAEVLWKAGVSPNQLQIVHGDRSVITGLVQEKDIRMISFTGGTSTAEAITQIAGLKKMAMDLGGNAAVIVMADSDFELAVESCVSGSFWASGHNCIGTQRILVERSIYEQFVGRFAELTRQMITGDPTSDATDMGPMISEDQAKRIETWVSDALAKGAKLICGHERKGSIYSPTVLTDVPTDCKVWSEEVFAPVVSIAPFDSFDAALAEANGSECSLHAGIFTRSLETALKAADQIEAGGVMINDSSDYRFDGMPFGGFKYGSLGREGVKFAIQEMTQPKVICINR